MPIDQLRTFINNNGHLPNVPSANEIETDGVNLGDAAKTSMEKIEELTLYLLEINDKVENQEEVLNEQSKLLEQQNETIRLQQELILELKNLTNKN
jgi:methyl-accepting chemotaxis protein